MNKKNGLNFSSVSIQNFVFMAGGSSSVAKALCMVTEGIETVDEIAAVQTGSMDRPIVPVVIKKMTLIEE